MFTVYSVYIIVPGGSHESHWNSYIHCFYFSLAVMGKLSGAVQGQMGKSFIMKKLCPLHLFFSRGSSDADRRQFHQEKGISTVSIFLWLLWVSSGVLGGSLGTNGGQFYQEKAMSTAFIFLWILGGLMELWIMNNNWNFSQTLFHKTGGKIIYIP